MTLIRHANQILLKDPVLQRIMEEVSLPNITESQCIFNKLVQTIVYQQLSLSAANTIYNRFLALFNHQAYLPNQLFSIELDTLRSCGLSRQKSNYVKNIAEYFLDKDSSIQHWKSKHVEEIKSELTSIKGVGPWTVDMICIFALQKEDVFPISDLTIRNVITDLYQLDTKSKNLHKKMEELAENWRPFRSVASRYLWTWKDQMK